MKKVLLLFLLAFAAFSCSYLDVVPDERVRDQDLFKDVTAAENYLYSCYSYLPDPRAGASSLDLFTGDEVITAFEHETFARFLKGTYTASSTVISYWDTFFQGLRQCQNLMKNLDNVQGLKSDVRDDYYGQLNFLIAYFHFLMARCYGPIILVDENTSLDVTMQVEMYEARRPYDECVKFICDKFDVAARYLPPVREEDNRYGFATSVAAKALKAKMLLYAASPLFNGGYDFSSLKGKDGTPLMPTSPDPDKWVRARQALDTAIRFAEDNGYRLLQEVGDFSNSTYAENTYPTLNSKLPYEENVEGILRYVIIEPGQRNKEILWADTREEDQYSTQIKSLPHSPSSAWNGVGPTLPMLQRFYSDKGLPLKHDKWFSTNPWKDGDVDRWSEGDKMRITDNAIALDNETYPGYTPNHFYVKESFVFNLHREPRYYAWVAFQGGYYEIRSASSNGAYNAPAYDNSNNGGRVKCDFTLNGSTSRGADASSIRKNNYAPSGFLNKKGVHPGFAVTTSLQKPKQYPWPIIRMADLYLCYAEACIESGEFSAGITNIDKIRKRAGIPSLQESWQAVYTTGAIFQPSDKDFLRERVREERMVELYLENQNFWDVRRWLKAKECFGEKQHGLNLISNTVDQLGEIVILNDFERNFNDAAHYLLPIPIKDISANPNIVQNPGY
jgi:hypothetical protein